MFRTLISKSAVAIMVFSTTVFAAGQPEKNSFKETTSHLEIGGPFYIYCSSEGFCAGVDGKVKAIRDFVLNEASSDDPDMKDIVTKGFDLGLSILHNSGLLDVSGAGASTVSLGDGLYSNKFFLHHYPDRGQGLMWNMYGKPHPLKEELSMLPVDTAAAQFCSFDLKLFWSFLKNEAEKSTLGFKKVLVDFEANLKKNEVDLNQLLDSFDGNFGLAITLKPDQMTMIPIGIGKFAQIPQPGIAIFIKVKDDYTFNVIKKKLARVIPPPAPGAAQPNPDEKRIDIMLPLPLPVPFMPVIVQEDGYIIAATNPALLDSIRAAKKDGKGLIATEEFKKLAAGIPENGNGCKFVGAAFSKAIANVQAQMMVPSGKQGANPFSGILGKLNVMGCIEGYFVMQVLDDGIFTAGNSNISIGNAILLQVAVAPTAVVAGMLLPALSTAREKARRVNCASNLKQFWLALKQYSIDNEDTFPKDDGVAGLELLRKEDYLTDYKVYLCPSASNVKGMPGQPLSESSVSYVYFGGFGEDDNADFPLAFDKPSNHTKFVNILFLDGHVEGVPGFFRTCSDVVNMLRKRKNYSAEDIKILEEKAAKFDSPMPARVPAR